MAWLLLAVFVVLAGTTAAALARQVKRQNEQAFAAQAASIGASVTTAVRRMDDLTLAARTMLGSRPDTTEREFANWYRSMGVEQRFSGVAGFGYVELVREAAARRLPARPAPLLLPPAARRRRPRHGRHARRADRPGPRHLRDHQPARRHARLRRVLRDRRHLQRGHEMFEVVAPGLPRRRRARARSTARRSARTGWIVGLFDAEPILRTAVGRQTGVAVTLERDHVADPGYRIPTGAGAAFRTLSETMQTASVARFGTAPPPATRCASACRSRPTAAGTSPSPAPSRAGMGDPEVQATLVLADRARARPARLRARCRCSPAAAPARCGWSRRRPASCATRRCTTR